MATPSPGPRSGDDTHDLIDDAPCKLAERRGARLGDDLIAITLIASLIDQAERFLPELVTNARLNGHTRDQIAQALATSPGEAQLRYRPQSPIADTRWPYDLQPWHPQPPPPGHPEAGWPARWHAPAFPDRCHRAISEAAGPGGAPAAKRGRTTWRWRQAAATIGNQEGHQPSRETEDASGVDKHKSIVRLAFLTE
jgi:hypothetical protein